MSVKLTQKGVLAQGVLEIHTNYETVSGFEYVERIKAMLSFLKAADPERITKDDVYFMICVLEDYLPTEKQADAFLQVSPH